MRCQSEYLVLSAEHTVRGSYFDTPFRQVICRAAFPNALSILLEWGLAPSNSPARSSLPLFNAHAKQTGSFLVVVWLDSRDPLAWILNRPFETRSERSDVVSGYATVKVLFGRSIFVYGSLVDNRTNEPTTVMPTE